MVKLGEGSTIKDMTPSNTSRLFNKILSRTFHTVILLIVAAVFLIPFAWILGSSFRPHSAIFQYSYPLTIHTFIPIDFTLSNFIDILFKKNFLRYLGNSFFVAGIMVAASWYINSIAAYAIERIDFYGDKFVYGVVLATMLVPLQAVMVPLYILVQNLGLHNTLWVLIVPWITEPFAVFLLVQHLKDIPRDLTDAAAIDGCGFWGTYWNVILPNIKRSLVTISLMKFIWAWNSFTWPLITINSESKFVIQVAIAAMNTRDTTYWGYTFAGTMLATVPVLIVFILAQRYFVEGSALTGMKT